MCVVSHVFLIRYSFANLLGVCQAWVTDLWRRTGRIALRAGDIPGGGGERAWCAGRVRISVGPRPCLVPSRDPSPDLCLQQLLCPAPSPCRGAACRLLWGICSCTGWHVDAVYPGLWNPVPFWWQWGSHETCRCCPLPQLFYCHTERMGSPLIDKSLKVTEEKWMV